ncbi:MAG: divalent metal cation transporter [Bacteroidia bacterium]
MSRTSRNTFSGIIFWSVISAAFIGPGTVTTAGKAGAEFGSSLIWALLFSTIATILLQEVSARIAITSGKNLGEAIRLRFDVPGFRWIRYFVGISVVFGCAAYQTGNLLGAVSGMSLWIGLNAQAATLTLGLACGLTLWLGRPEGISRFLGLVVAVMGLLFVAVAFRTKIPAGEWLSGTFIPAIPENSGLLVIGLVGTTIVPYNLFLGSGIGKGQDIQTMRRGLIPAVAIGGVISVAILIAATGLDGTFSFQELAELLRKETGEWAAICFAMGLFAAGFTSAITAPLASAITAQSIWGNDDPAWKSDGRNFRQVWLLVLMAGIVFGVSGIRPVPAIIAAQALNGLLLPFFSVCLLLVVNDKKIMPPGAVNKPWMNVAMILIVGITFFLGAINLWRAYQSL